MAAYADFAFFYDKLTDAPEYEKRCEYIVDLLAENGISKGILLDLACGTGNFSEYLSDRGFDVIGTDASEEMLSVALEKSMGKEKKVLYLCQDMAETDLYGTINAAVCLLDSINHVTDPEKVSMAFEKVGLFMEKGGIFIFDVNTRYKHRNILANNTFVYDTDDVYCVWQNELDEETDTVHISLDLFAFCEEDEVYERYEEQFDEVIYDEEYLKNELEKSGFKIKHIYDDMTHSQLHGKSQRAIYVCEKIIETNSVFEE